MIKDKQKNPNVKIEFHGCENRGQDEMYGPQMRVWNHAPGQKNVKLGRFRCTVCGQDK